MMDHHGRRGQSHSLTQTDPNLRRRLPTTAYARSRRPCFYVPTRPQPKLGAEFLE